MFKYLRNDGNLYEFKFPEKFLYDLLCCTPIYDIAKDNTPLLDRVGDIQKDFKIYKDTDALVKDVKSLPEKIVYIFYHDMEKAYTEEIDSKYDGVDYLNVEVLYFYLFGKTYTSMFREYRKVVKDIVYGKCDEAMVAWYLK